MPEPLFPGYGDPPAPAVPDRSLSAGQRLTLRQRADVKRGVHPLTRLPLLPLIEDHTCGDCVFRYRSGDYPKCRKMHHAASAANDCRAWWPACTQWEAKPDA